MVNKLCAGVPYIDLSFISLVSNFLVPVDSNLCYNTIFDIMRQNAHFETTALLLWIKIQG